MAPGTHPYASALWSEGSLSSRCCTPGVASVKAAGPWGLVTHTLGMGCGGGQDVPVRANPCGSLSPQRLHSCVPEGQHRGVFQRSGWASGDALVLVLGVAQEGVTDGLG